jgi:hypothetical protein
MPGIISIVVGAVMILGGFGTLCAASEAHASSAPRTICFVGGVIMMALGRVIYLLGGILRAIKTAKAK